MDTKHTQGKMEADEFSLTLPSPRNNGRYLEIAYCSDAEDAKGNPVISDSERKANASRLALCWNMHDELIAALESVIDCHETGILGQQGINGDRARSKLAQQARAAIAKTKGA
jgi:hypothetical protein